MLEEKLKHLEFIQNVITRMNSNSFQLKGISVTIVAAIYAVYASTNKVSLLFVGLIPTFIFWVLDTYYLQQERKYCSIYENVAGIKNDIKVPAFGMSTSEFKKGKYSFPSVFWSRTVALLYGLMILFQLGLGLIICIANK